MELKVKEAIRTFTREARTRYFDRANFHSE